MPDATPFETVTFIYATSPGSTAVPGCAGVKIGVDSPDVMGSSVADAYSSAVFGTNVPAAAAGLLVGFVVVELGTCRTSAPVAHQF